MTTLTHALDLYLVQLLADGRSPHTLAQVRRHVLLLARWLAEQGLPDDVAALDPPALAKFLASPEARLTSEGAAKRPSSSNALRTSLRVFGNYLHAADLVAANPARLIRRARCTPPPPKPLSDDEVVRLLEAMTEEKNFAAYRDFALFSMLAGCGLRIGSALAARIEDLDFARGVLWIKTAKGGVQGRVIVPSAQAEILRAIIGPRTTGPIFPASHGGPMSTRSAASRLQYWARRAGVQNASPHRLRHHFATRLLESSGNLALVQHALMHKSIASTLVYTMISDERLRNAIEA